MPTDTQQLPLWDLGGLYNGIDDTAVDRDLTEGMADATAFAQTYKGALAKEATSAELLVAALQEYEKILELVNKVTSYAYLEFSVASTDAAYGAFMQNVQLRARAIENEVMFFDLEVGSLPAETLEKLAGAAELRAYQKYLKKVLNWKPHRLSEAEERILSDTLSSGAEAHTRLFEQESAGLTFRLKETDSGDELSLTDALATQKDHDRETRKAGADAITKTLQDTVRLPTYLYNTLLLDKSIRDRYRKFDSPEHAQHLSNETTQESVDAMIRAVTNGYNTCERIYLLKRNLMKVGELHEYDRYAPTAESEKRYTYQEAQDLILEAFRAFSPQYAEAGQAFFDNNWIHARPMEGKQHGAYCLYTTPDHHPYLLVNFTGTMDDVSTLAHELGHGIQAYLAREQTMLNFDWPLTIAETASVFSEMLVFDHLKSKLDERDQLALIVEKLDSIVATVYRQVAMFQFERDAHARRAEGELTSDDLGKLWQRRMQEMFGKSLTLRDGHALWWSYIPHIVRTPFYVYSYAFGELLTLALYAKYREEGDVMAETYIKMLSKGGSEFPQELLQPLGIDLDDPAFWGQGMKMIEGLLAEAELLWKKAPRTDPT